MKPYFVKVSIVLLSFMQVSLATTSSNINNKTTPYETMISTTPYLSHIFYEMGKKCGVSPQEQTNRWLNFIVSDRLNHELANQARTAIHQRNHSSYQLAIQNMTCPNIK